MVDTSEEKDHKTENEEEEGFKISAEEWNEISSKIEIHHALFYELWQMGKPVLTKSIPTAAVGFSEEGRYVEFKFNPDFWQKLSTYERMFVICHECLHIIFNHGYRMLNTNMPQVCNVAMDVVVNHTLANNFNFKKDQINIKEDLCWLDTVFGEDYIKEGIYPNETFEYYFNKIKEKCEFIQIDSFDSHDGLKKHFGSEDALKDLIEKLNESLTDEEKQSIKHIIQKHIQKDKDQEGLAEDVGQLAGDGTFGRWRFTEIKNVKKKKKWETVIQKWSKKYLKREEDSIEQWARSNRRFSLIKNQNLFLPSEVDQENWSEDRITVWFFQDCSGSCYNLKDRFFKAALSLPKNRFDVKMHTFDTRVYEADLKSKSKLRGWGGTTFTCIEKYIQTYIKKQKGLYEQDQEYPKAIFVITDGYGNRVKPEKPKNWYWFLTNNFKNYIPKESSVFHLSNFE